MIYKNKLTAAANLLKVKPKPTTLGQARDAAKGVLNFLGKGKIFAATTFVGAGAGSLIKAFENGDPSTYLTNDKQANAMILDTLDRKKREDRIAAMDSAPEFLDEVDTAAQLGVTAASIPGSGAVYKARRLPSTTKIDGATKSRAAMGPVRAALGPVGKALSGFATPLGVAAITPLSVANQLYEGDSVTDIATNPLNYLAPAFAGTVAKEATRGMRQTGALAKTLKLGMSPGAIKMISRRFGLPGLAISSGISLYELADDYKNNRGLFGKKE